jgi:hypothetical protein
MPILESRTDQSTRQRLLLATSLGAAAGFEIWGLAACGFAFRLPWYGPAWLLLSHVLLGLTIGATAGSARWWKLGLTLGLGFSLPPALGVLALGLQWRAYGLALFVEGMTTALLIALLANSIFPREQASAVPPVQRPTLPTTSACRESGGTAMDTLGQRLAKGKDILERLDAARIRQGNQCFGKTAEDKVIWCELLDLELQDLDELIGGGRKAGARPGRRIV